MKLLHLADLQLDFHRDGVNPSEKVGLQRDALSASHDRKGKNGS
ncbi:MAG: hypothetical protein V7695_20150 [Sulfitobacter sp.]|jgi:hypothetical protein